ncbi:hypothetical protein M426DRAFT_17667 [Hypoxylon sp. CI-4A]|nr:hypothetical protein M426DRAFT_17667 [Hypoxylon sp. CI-4A]
MSIYCAHGHRHIGKYGAAGFIIFRYRKAGTGAGEIEMLLARRHNGWSTIGGLIDRGESPLQAAFRELKEEIGLHHSFIIPVTVSPADHGGWCYTTFLAMPRTDLEISDLTLDLREVSEVRWFTRRELQGQELHWPFRDYTVPQLDTILPPDWDLRTGRPWNYTGDPKQPRGGIGINRGNREG